VSLQDRAMVQRPHDGGALANPLGGKQRNGMIAARTRRTSIHRWDVWRQVWRATWARMSLLATGHNPAELARPVSASQQRFEAFFRRHEREVFGYLWRLTGDEQAAYDLCQETFLRAWQRFATISAYEQPGAWLFRVATNLAINDRRARNRSARATSRLDDTLTGETDPAQRLGMRDAVRRALLAVAPRQRAALVLREVYGLSCEEVAETLGTSAGAAKAILWRGREAFREHYLREEGRP
jgi:RNA polymerase sigma-70 factor (ECF subfamily)